MLFKWSKDDSAPNHRELQRFLDNFNGNLRGEAERSLARLLIFDSQTCMGIIKTRHTLVGELKSQLTEANKKYSLPKFQVILVSGTIKTLKQRLLPANSNKRNGSNNS